ncbi:MAG: hypothetical protein JXA94_05855 [Parachlamydiales bacterium]|nr:hypothetical protein [Parachlamydiales bacterium]
MKNLRVSIDKANSLKELNDIVYNTQPKVSFLAGRSVIANGYEGSVSLSYLVKKLFNLVGKNFEFTQKDRNIGKVLVSNINYLYVVTDAEIAENKNFFTKRVDKIRNYFETKVKNPFDYYTEKDFKKAFPYNDFDTMVFDKKSSEILRKAPLNRIRFIDKYLPRFAVATFDKIKNLASFLLGRVASILLILPLFLYTRRFIMLDKNIASYRAFVNILRAMQAPHYRIV